MNWKKRQQQLNKQLEKDEEKLKKRLSSYFDAEYRKLEKQIASYYQQYGEDNVIQYRRMMESLPDADKRLLLEQMDEFAKKYPEYAYLMPIRESIYKLNRLEGLQYSIRMQQLEIGAIENEQISEHLNRQAMRGANAAAETMGFGKNFYANNPDITKSFVNVAWSDGENFSQKIWNNTSKLANYLNTDIAQGFARGDPYERLTRKLRERFGKVSRNDAYRLIYTEGTYVMAEATMQPFKEDFEQYRLSTAADGKVCSICRDIAQEVFNISDRQPGINFPPLHPWCRCTFTIEVDDWDAWMDEYEQRHRDGQAKKIVNRLKMSSVNNPEFLENIEALSDNQRSNLESELKLMPERHMEIIKNAIKGIKIDENGNSRYNSIEKIVYLSNDLEQGEAIHELAHVLERELDIWEDKKYIDAIRGTIGEIEPFYEVVRDDETFVKPIWRLNSESLVSVYQGRVYKEYVPIINSDMRFNIKSLGDFFSEAYREFIYNPERLKEKQPLIYDYIEEMMR